MTAASDSRAGTASPADAFGADLDGRSRAAARHKIFLPIGLRMASGDYRAHLLNISSTGALIHCRQPLARDDWIILSLFGDGLPARVCWVSGNRCGVTFKSSLAPSRLGALLLAVSAR